ncbi:hypothetical protein HO173_005759 [Letharia columbiana]|uniref:Uncharacterized protein n=1 Tax=Letharia columbiana TaxID=112416 RepID=A0A8H6FWI4_9LECA|nr:uncharacterized protein HO173_005759 [Letharia columbiana]KAF6236130.1 hypothetical protein HO173_005759 [Letharia columbiana]
MSLLPGISHNNHNRHYTSTVHRHHFYENVAYSNTHPPRTMLFLQKTLTLAAILISFCAPMPLIRIQNISKENICYMVEYSNGTGTFPNETICGIDRGFWLNSGQTKDFKATGFDGEHFNGAVTAWLKNNTFRGARNEINLLNQSMAWYDVSYQYGISDGTCGPANSSDLSGEKDSLGKANSAWKTLSYPIKRQLLKSPQYLRQGKNGSLVHINMGVEAFPYGAPDVVMFFQATAGFKAYMGSGSATDVTWPPNSVQAELVPLADKQTLSAPTDHIVITSY